MSSDTSKMPPPPKGSASMPSTSNNNDGPRTRENDASQKAGAGVLAENYDRMESLMKDVLKSVIDTPHLAS